MIQITAYLRDEADYELWKAIGNKAEFLHNALNLKSKDTKISDGLIAGGAQMYKLGKPIKTPEEAKKAVEITKPEASVKLCPVHKTPLTEAGKCLQKGCKYAWVRESGSSVSMGMPLYLLMYTFSKKVAGAAGLAS